jgi:hypothetical protein
VARVNVSSNRYGVGLCQALVNTDGRRVRASGNVDFSSDSLQMDCGDNLGSTNVRETTNANVSMNVNVNANARLSMGIDPASQIDFRLYQHGGDPRR